MRSITNKILFFAALFCAFSLNVHADWQITGDAVEQGTQAVLAQSSDNSQKFIFVGKLAAQPFKITDGVKTYIHECGDNDPLGDLIPLREEANSNETGLRIRYVGPHDYFRVTLTVAEGVKSLEAERLEIAKNMYIMGGPFNNETGNWKLQDAVELEADKENPFVFYYKGDIRYNQIGDERGSLKILKGRGWGENYHPDAAGDVALSQAIGTPLKIRLGGADNKWTIPADRTGDGYYEIKIDLLNLTILVEKFTQDIVANPLPLAVYIAGDAMSCGWNNEHPVAMQKIENGIFQWQGKVSEGPFKFLQRRGTWERCYVATSEDEQIVSGKEYNVVYEESYFVQGNDYKFVIPEAGDCQLTLNLNTMKLKVGGDPISGIKPEYNNDKGVIFFSENGKLFLKSEYGQPLQAQVFGIDGKLITRKIFSESTDISLPKGCYIVLLSNEAGERISSVRTIVN